MCLRESARSSASSSACQAPRRSLIIETISLSSPCLSAPANSLIGRLSWSVRRIRDSGARGAVTDLVRGRRAEVDKVTQHGAQMRRLDRSAHGVLCLVLPPITPMARRPRSDICLVYIDRGRPASGSDSALVCKQKYHTVRTGHNRSPKHSSLGRAGDAKPR